MRKALFGALALALVAATTAAAQTGYGQVTLANTSGQAVDLYVDGDYACRALRGGHCTAQILAGAHTLTVQSGHEVLDREAFELESGGTYTHSYP